MKWNRRQVDTHNTLGDFANYRKFCFSSRDYICSTFFLCAATAVLPSLVPFPLFHSTQFLFFAASSGGKINLMRLGRGDASEHSIITKRWDCCCVGECQSFSREWWKMWRILFDIFIIYQRTAWVHACVCKTSQIINPWNFLWFIMFTFTSESLKEQSDAGKRTTAQAEQKSEKENTSHHSLMASHKGAMCFVHNFLSLIHSHSAALCFRCWLSLSTQNTHEKKRMPTCCSKCRSDTLFQYAINSSRRLASEWALCVRDEKFQEVWTFMPSFFIPQLDKAYDEVCQRLFLRADERARISSSALLVLCWV